MTTSFNFFLKGLSIGHDFALLSNDQANTWLQAKTRKKHVCNTR